VFGVYPWLWAESGHLYVFLAKNLSLFAYFKSEKLILKNYLNLKVNHAHWIGENTTCVALKIYYEKYFNQELDVLKYLNEIDDHERNYIIKMFGQWVIILIIFHDLHVRFYFFYPSLWELIFTTVLNWALSLSSFFLKIFWINF